MKPNERQQAAQDDQVAEWQAREYVEIKWPDDENRPYEYSERVKKYVASRAYKAGFYGGLTRGLEECQTKEDALNRRIIQLEDALDQIRNSGSTPAWIQELIESLQIP